MPDHMPPMEVAVLVPLLLHQVARRYCWLVEGSARARAKKNMIRARGTRGA